MQGLGKAFLGGSRIVRWTVFISVPIAMLVAPAGVDRWDLRHVARVAVVEAVLVLALLGVGWPARFRWAGRVLGALVFLGFAWYLADELLKGPQDVQPSASNSSTSVWGALKGMIVFGLPSLWFAVRGRFGFGAAAGKKAALDPAEGLPTLPEQRKTDEPG